jgi:hypothetical protein
MAIQDILYQHSRGLDRMDVGQIKACYWPDAAVDYGAYKGPAHAFAEMVVPALAASYELTRHTLGNTVFLFDAGEARTESHVTAQHLLLGGEEEMLFSGRYLDTLCRREGEWKMLHRHVVMDWSRRMKVVDERASEAFADLVKGGHGATDPSYAHLGNMEQGENHD